ncbi:MAG: hypothetical protein H7Y17_15430 [Chlorobia bacterium]|nr:hypothetical protein [Fimbriimonadaceae bacterium]
MRQEPIAVNMTEDFDPLLPIDIISPPNQRGAMTQPETTPPIEPKETPESEIEEHKMPYKGDVNAPLEAEHPLANPPETSRD